MRVCLASAPTVAEFRDLGAVEDEDTQRLPLGVLTLASALERMGLAPEVVDLDLLYAAWRRGPAPAADFARHAAERLAASGAELYGLGTICGSYPLTLRIATALKTARPRSWIVLGGPQATAAADETLAAFPAIDVVVRGEGEPVFPPLVRTLAASGDLASVAGISHRAEGRVVRTPDAAPVDDLDALPAPAYHLHPLRRGGCLPLEAGRGCPFSCTFCSTSRFFGRRFRMRSPGRLVEEMLALRRAYGTRRFDLVHDNFTVDRRRVVAFCDALSSAGAGITWSCASRTDTLDEDLVDVMSKAGCRGIFFGVESGSEAMQRSMNKRLDLAATRERLRRVSRRRMASTVSFVTGFPEEREEDLRATVSFFVEMLRHDFLQPQISLLSPLSGTAIHERHRGELFLDEVLSDVVFQGEEQDPADRELIRRHPDVFPSFYGVPTPALDRRELDELRHFLLNARYDLRWLLVAAAQVAGDGVEAFRGFRGWRERGSAADGSRAEMIAYYASPRFRRDFLRFAREELARRHRREARALRDLARFYTRFQGAPGAARRRRPRPGKPIRACDVRVTRIASDGRALLRCLRGGGQLGRVPRRPSTLVTRVRQGQAEIVSVRNEAADLLRLCDGRRDVRGVVAAFRRLHARVGGVPAETACAFGLARLEQSGLVAFT